MQLKRKTFGVVAACLATLALAAPAQANTTYTADNDSTTYVTFPDSYNGGDAYAKLSSGNYGDSRIAWGLGAGSYYYNWWIGTNLSYYDNIYLDAYLANVNFNNRSATYYYESTAVNTIDQNAAPSGWSNVGWESDYGTVKVRLSSRDYKASGTNTGADTIRLWYVY